MDNAAMPGVVRLREQREALTRHTILRAARELFAERGYANTPVRLLAQRAGVALQTVYATYGSKAGVVAALPDLLDHEAGIVEVFEMHQELTDPVELVGLLARIARQVRERCNDIIMVLRSGAAVDKDIATALAEGQRRHRLGIAAIIKRIDELGELAIDRAKAVDIARAMMTYEISDVLLDEAGWSYDAYEQWLASSLVMQLLEPAGP